mgnify:CR=1 FL=1
MDGMIYLSLAYIAMIAAIAIWTWTVVTRSRSIEARLAAVESTIGLSADEGDDVASQSVDE